MRVEKLQVRHFGPFEDAEFDFRTDGVAFLYGLNGDGKTTLTRAIVDLFFGIPSRSAARNDGWRYSQVPEIIATVSGLESLGSTEATIVRRGGGLSDQDGNDLDKDLFGEITKGLDKVEFSGLYRVGHGELTEGGKRLSAQEGDLGAIVFGVSLGGSLDAKATLDDLNEEAGKLFALEGKQTRGKRVTEDLSRLAEHRTQIQESSTTPPEFAENERKIREKTERRETCEGECVEFRAEIERLEMLGKVLPGLVKRQKLTQELGKLDSFQALRSEIDSLSLDLGGIEVQVERLEEFENTLTGNKLKELLESLGVEGVSDPDQALAKAQEILGLSDEGLVEHFRSSDSPGQLDTKLRQLDRDLVEGLEELDYFPRKDGESDHDYVERFAELQVPLEVDVARDQQEEITLRERIADKEASREETKRQLEAKKRELDTKTSNDEVPDRQALERAREERQGKWEQIRSAWVDGRKAPEDPAELAITYEGTVEAADLIADALVDHAEAVNIANAIESLEERERVLEGEIEAAREDLKDHLEACQERWNIGGNLADFNPRSADAVSDWLSRVDVLATIRRDISDRAIELQAQVKRGRDELEEALEQKGGVASVVDGFVTRVGEVAGKLGLPIPSNAPEAVKVARDLQLKIDEIDDLQSQKDELEMKLLKAGQGTQADDLAEEIDDRDSAELKQTADQLRRDIAAREQEIDLLDREIQPLEDWRREVSARGSFEVKQMELEADALADSIEENIRRFLTLSLVATELDQSMNSFGETSAVEVCEAAEATFVELSEGRFERLERHFEDGNAWITVVRADTAEEVEIDKLSDGERDALYLAFRLATLRYQLERMSEADRPPIILDDVFIGLDNNRSKAGLRAIHELSELTQVIFLTHHEHIVDLAGQVLDGSTFTELQADSYPPGGVAA